MYMDAMCIAIPIFNTMLRCPEATRSACAYAPRLRLEYSSWTPQACTPVWRAAVKIGMQLVYSTSLHPPDIITRPRYDNHWNAARGFHKHAPHDMGPHGPVHVHIFRMSGLRARFDPNKIGEPLPVLPCV